MIAGLIYRKFAVDGAHAARAACQRRAMWCAINFIGHGGAEALVGRRYPREMRWRRWLVMMLHVAIREKRRRFWLI